MKKHIYPADLEREIIKNKCIPRRMNPYEHLKLYHKYWLPEFKGVVKVHDVWNDHGNEYYSLKCPGRIAICISYPLDEYDGYELLHNYGSLENEDIINSDRSYSGAEIKFWFVANQIDLSDSKYYGFWSYLNSKSDKCLTDNKAYKVVKDKRKCLIIPDKKS